MWRASSKILDRLSLPSATNSPHQGCKTIGRRNLSNRKPPNTSSSTTVSVVGAAAVTLIGGSVVLAKTSERYRDFSEKYIPGSTFLYKIILGPKVEAIPVIEQKPNEGLIKKKLDRDALKKKDNILIITTEGSSSPPVFQLEPPKASEDLPPSIETPSAEAPVAAEPAVESAVEATSEPTDAAVISGDSSGGEIVEELKTEEVGARASDEIEEMTVGPIIVADPADFPALLAELQNKAAEAVSDAVAAQDAAASSIKKHVEMVYKALEMVYDPNQTPEHVWEPVYQATQDKLEAIQRAEGTAKEARMAVAILKETIAHGIKNDQSIETPDLITFDESVARALYSLETAKARVEAAQSEAKVMDEYRNLVDTARRHLQLELSSIRPELAPSFKVEGQSGKLAEEELNILMAHAYWKIITLQKELARQQTLEQQRLRSALEVQRKEDVNIMESRLRVEMEKQYYELKAQFGHDMTMHEKNMSEQFTQQLKRQAAAHTDHLNEVLAVQHEELSRKHLNQLELQAAQQQVSQSQELAKLRGLAKGMQDSVHARANKDRLAREVRELWLAAQSLMDSLRSNATAHLQWEGQRRILSQPLALLSHVTDPQDDFIKCIVDSIPQQVVDQGVLPQGAIKERFLDVERVCRKVALIDDNGGSLIKYALSYLQSLLVIKTDMRSLPKLDENNQIDADQLNTFDILARARYHLEKDDVENALRYMNLLRGEPLLVAGDWLQEVRCHLETVQAAQAILVYAAVASIESM